MNVQAEPTPNPNAMKFTADQTIFESSTSLKKGEETDHPTAKKLLVIEGVDNIFGINDFVTVNKTEDANWDDLLPEIEKAFED
ncbi:NifU N-terminal domain-containing protein [Salicibibacter cibarius]|uniref:NifU N-terminal domain-containing protein n=1 Tax=Salicibibacter cibarius TaxID=2743000 RepID=A0A7T6Z0C2_9BACI|nr:NifU N-terminal domain-containing protein [Salicibibacter cibarius]QQK74638.1 NifU N-terminal domain-containing protein [Salicibibacter cibarius]